MGRTKKKQFCDSCLSLRFPPLTLPHSNYNSTQKSETKTKRDSPFGQYRKILGTGKQVAVVEVGTKRVGGRGEEGNQNK